MKTLIPLFIGLLILAPITSSQAATVCIYNDWSQDVPVSIKWTKKEWRGAGQVTVATAKECTVKVYTVPAQHSQIFGCSKKGYEADITFLWLGYNGFYNTSWKRGNKLDRCHDKSSLTIRSNGRGFNVYNKKGW